jgi:hypothetical protein
MVSNKNPRGKPVPVNVDPDEDARLHPVDEEGTPLPLPRTDKVAIHAQPEDHPVENHAEDEKAAGPATEEVVRFMGFPGIRLISAGDWEAAGVKDHADTYWNSDNNWVVKRADLGLNDEQYARIIVADPNFRVENV